MPECLQSLCKISIFSSRDFIEKNFIILSGIIPEKYHLQITIFGNLAFKSAFRYKCGTVIDIRNGVYNHSKRLAVIININEKQQGIRIRLMLSFIAGPFSMLCISQLRTFIHSIMFARALCIPSQVLQR